MFLLEPRVVHIVLGQHTGGGVIGTEPVICHIVVQNL
jgi:hypothetical protein